MCPTRRLPTEQRRRQIAAAALQIIADRGVRALTAIALAREVGIADGTLFRHFKSMDEIAQAAIDLFEESLEATYPAQDLELDPLERLGRFLIARLTLVRKSPEILRLAFNDRLAEAAGDQGARRVQRVVNRSLTFIHRCLSEARERGQVGRAADPSLLVWMVIGVLRGASMKGTYRVTDQKALSSSSPRQVWRSLERLFGSIGEE